MNDDWSLFIELEKEKNNSLQNYKKCKSKYSYTIDKIKEEETDFFKKSQIKEKNMYLNSYNQYKLKVNK